MGLLEVILINSGLASIGLALFVAYVYWYEQINKYLCPQPDKRKVLPYADHHWTLSDRGNDDSGKIVPFRLDVAEDLLDDLRARLRNTRYGTPSVQDANFVYGFPSSELQKVVNYWLDEFNWRKQEDYINQFPQFQTNIEGLNIHFVRASPKNVGPDVRIFPILLVHGWPGSFFELLKLVPLLTEPRKISPGGVMAFEVIIPSLPGYGFSDAPQKTGLETSHMARIFSKLMTRLNLEKYFIHGGDWGSHVCRMLAIMYPERVLGVELTAYQIPIPPNILKGFVSKFLPSLLMDPEERHKLFFPNIKSLLRETGYFHINATKPDTVGAGLSDSPAGLAAYILEKFSTWTNQGNINTKDGHLTSYFTLDELLTDVMIYWISNSITSSCRLYKEQISSRDGLDNVRSYSIEVPCVLSDFAHEIIPNPPSALVAPYYTDLIKVSKHSTGGHFPSMERPKDVAEDIWLLGSTVAQRGSI